LCYFVLTKKQILIIKYNNKMTNTKKEAMKSKVIAKLIKYGNNENEVKEMVSLHFDYAFSKYSTVKRIADCIRTIY